MAEFIFKELVREKGLTDCFLVASAATSTEEIRNGIGNPVYPPARAKLSERGINCDGKRAVQLKAEDYENYDYLIGMDEMNIRNMKYILGGDPERKIYKLLTFAGKNRDISDPWYTDDFETTYQDIAEGCAGLLCFLKDSKALCGDKQR